MESFITSTTELTTLLLVMATYKLRRYQKLFQLFKTAQTAAPSVRTLFE